MDEVLAWVAWVALLHGWHARAGGMSDVLALAAWVACYYYCYCYY